MSIKRTIITTIVALVLVAVVAPVNVNAVTIDELLAQIAVLQAQLIALQQAQGGTPATGACAGVTFTRNLVVGSTGSDVKCLQQILNQSASTQVAVTGAGAPGYETTYFGPKTLAAVRIYQAAKGYTPANQVGPLTRAALNADLGGVVPPIGPIIPTGAGLSVMLSSATPAAGIVVAGQGLAPLAKLTFVNGDNAAVKVTSLKLTRIGVSADADLANVYLLQGATRLTDSASVSSSMVNFNDSNGLFTVPSGSSVEITVASDICNTTNCTTIVGQTIGVSVASAANVTTNASSVKGTFPVNGNLFTVSNASLATVVFAASTTPSTNTSLNPQNDYVVWQNSTVIGTRSVNLSRLALREVGSINYSDLQNFRLNIDGVNVGSAVAGLDSNGYVTFDLSSSPKTLLAGTRVIKVMTDIIAGSSRTFAFSIRVAADANFIDSQYLVNIAPTTATTSGSFTLSDVTAGTQTVASGTLTMAKTTDSPSGNIVDGASNALLAKYSLTAAGERVKITDLYIRAVESDATDCVSGTYTLRNGALYANGVQIGSTTNIGEAAAGTHFSLGSALIVNPGSPVTLEVKADIYDNGSTTNCVASADTIYAQIVAGSSNAQGMVSLATISTPSAAVNGNTLTNAVGALVLSKYTAYTDQNAVPPMTAYKLSHFTLSNNTVEPVNITTIKAYLGYVSAWTTNLYVKYGTNVTAITPITAASQSYSVNYQLGLGQTVDMMVYGDVSSSANGLGCSNVYITGTTANSATAVTAGTDAAAGTTCTYSQTITFTTGSFTTAVDGATPLDQVVAGGQSVVAGKFKVTAQNDSYTLQRVRFTVANNDTSSAVISSLSLKDGSTVLATVPYDSSNNWFDIDGMTLAIAANSTKVLTAEYNLATPYTDGTTVTTGKNATLTMSYMTVINSTGTVSHPTTAKVANYTYVYKTFPTFANVAVTGQGTNLASGSTVELYKFTVKADAKGDVALKQLKFAVDITDNAGASTAPTLDTFSFFRGGTNLTTSVRIQDVSASTLEDTTSNLDENDNTAVYVTFNTEETVPAGSTYTYTLKARAQGFGSLATDPDSVSTSLSADTVPATAAVGADTDHFWLASLGQSETAIQKLEASANSATGDDYNVIWSDESAQLHGYEVTTLVLGASADWFNGYLIESLPLNTQGINYAN